MKSLGKLRQAVYAAGWQFLMDVDEAIRPRKPLGCVIWPLHLRVQAAYKELYAKHGAKVTKKMIRQTVDPEQKDRFAAFQRAFQKAGLDDLPKGRGRSLGGETVPKKNTKNWEYTYSHF